ncbi:MAG: ParB/RepB/Spo0J family partition protein [Candidatus Magasanikbacteria bacterium]|nr:ParB/RepB/Spo0J family partition protein [Candidatus Magasanikbacteria bacterium]
MSLGRGLSALLSATAPRKKLTLETSGTPTSISVPAPSPWQVPVSAIAPSPRQPRRRFAEAELAELAESLRQHGVLQPLLVTELPGGKFELVAGERRLRAAEQAGLPTVPVMIKKFAADRDKLAASLVENLQREDLNPIEEAFAYQRLTNEFGLTQAQVADTVGKSRPAVANTLRLLTLPKEAQEALIEKTISAGQARALLSLERPAEQLQLLAELLASPRPVRALEAEVVARRGTPKRRDPNLAYLENQLRTALGTKVRISRRGGRGTIVLYYFSEEELKQLLSRLTPRRDR